MKIFTPERSKWVHQSFFTCTNVKLSPWWLPPSWDDFLWWMYKLWVDPIFSSADEEEEGNFWILYCEFGRMIQRCLFLFRSSEWWVRWEFLETYQLFLFFLFLLHRKSSFVLYRNKLYFEWDDAYNIMFTLFVRIFDLISYFLKVYWSISFFSYCSSMKCWPSLWFFKFCVELNRNSHNSRSGSKDNTLILIFLKYMSV